MYQHLKLRTDVLCVYAIQFEQRIKSVELKTEIIGKMLRYLINLRKEIDIHFDIQNYVITNMFGIYI